MCVKTRGPQLIVDDCSLSHFICSFVSTGWVVGQPCRSTHFSLYVTYIYEFILLLLFRVGIVHYCRLQGMLDSLLNEDCRGQPATARVAAIVSPESLF